MSIYPPLKPKLTDSSPGSYDEWIRVFNTWSVDDVALYAQMLDDHFIALIFDDVNISASRAAAIFNLSLIHI